MRQRNKRILTFTGLVFIIGFIGCGTDDAEFGHISVKLNAAVAHVHYRCQKFQHRTASEQARQHQKQRNRYDESKLNDDRSGNYI